MAVTTPEMACPTLRRLPGLRNAVFFRRTVTPTVPVTHLGFEGLVDDGAIIYVNGAEVARMNVDPATAITNWAVYAESMTVNGGTTEQGPQSAVAFDLNLPANTPIEIGVMLVNENEFNQDLGMDMRVFIADRIPVDFEMAINSLNSSAYDLFWESVPGAYYNVEVTEDYITWDRVVSNVIGGGTGLELITVFPAVDRASYRVHRTR